MAIRRADIERTSCCLRALARLLVEENKLARNGSHRDDDKTKADSDSRVESASGAGHYSGTGGPKFALFKRLPPVPLMSLY